jgi:hypothetical protein
MLIVSCIAFCGEDKPEIFIQTAAAEEGDFNDGLIELLRSFHWFLFYCRYFM